MNSTMIDSCFHKKIDYTPCWFMRQAGRCIPEYRVLREKHDFMTLIKTPALAAEITVMPVKKFGVDAAILFADIMNLPAAIGVNLEIIPEIGPIIQNPIRTKRDIEKLKDTPKGIEFMGESIKLSRAKLDVPLIGFSGAPFTLACYMIEGKPSKSFTLTKAFMHNQPEEWKMLMEKLSNAIIEYLEFQINSGVQAIQLFDTWVGCLSKEDYIKFVLPFTAKIFKKLKNRKVPMIYFGTDNSHLMDQISLAGSDVIGIDWRYSMTNAIRFIRNGQAVQGNLDPALLLCKFETMKKEVDKIFVPLEKRTGFIFNLGHGVYPDTPVENVVKLVKYVHSKRI